MAKRHVLVSGATSPVGRAFVEHLAAAGHRVYAFYPGQTPSNRNGIRWISAADLTDGQQIAEIGIDAYVNLTSKDPGVPSSDGEAIARSVADLVTSARIPNVIVVSSIAASIVERGDAHSRRHGLHSLAADRVYQQRLIGCANW